MSEFHTAECNTSQARRKVEQAFFALMYPRFCATCNGLGYITWSDPDVGLSSVQEPCAYCEGRPDELDGAICAICATPGDFEQRTLLGGPEDRRPCDCPTHLEYPPNHECFCWDAEAAYMDDNLPGSLGYVSEAEIDQDETDYISDLGFDAARERAALRQMGRD